MNEHPTINAVSLASLQAQSLEQLSDKEFWSYARKLARLVPANAYPEEYLECNFSAGRCLIPLAALYEVAPPPHRFALLPATPGWMLGLVAWLGEAIAVVDLGAYLFECTIESPSEGILLVANSVGLLVPTIGLTTIAQIEQKMPLTDAPERHTSLQAGLVNGVYAEAPLLDVPILLADVVEQIRTAVSHG